MHLSKISLALRQWGNVDPDAAIMALFANSEVGAWYDPSDLSTMFQDSAGTTPVTADGQPVGKILDKSGRGNHASQATAASRPLYKTDGTYHWLQFDGVDDTLSTAVIVWGTNKITSIVGVRNTSNSAIRSLFGSGNWNDKNTFECFTPFDATGKFESGWQGNLGYAWRETGARTVDVNHVLTMVLNGDGTTTATEVPTFRDNTVQQTTIGGSGIDNTQNLVANPLYVGARMGAALFTVGNLYSLIVRAALSTTQEITDTETWVNSKTGAY